MLKLSFYMDRLIPKCQMNNPLGDAYLFENHGLPGCFVFNQKKIEWESLIRTNMEEGYIYIFFPTTCNVWKCKIHVNIACIVPLDEHTKDETDSVVKYFVMTAKNTHPDYKIVNMTGYRLYFYLEDDYLPRRSLTNRKPTTTVLGAPIKKLREYLFTIEYDCHWNLVKNDYEEEKVEDKKKDDPPIQSTFKYPVDVFNQNSDIFKTDTLWKKEGKAENKDGFFGSQPSFIKSPATSFQPTIPPFSFQTTQNPSNPFAFSFQSQNTSKPNLFGGKS